MGSLRISFVAALLLLVGAVVFSTAAPTLVTDLGNVTGFETQVNGTAVEVFYGIPFAAPPLGTRRFGFTRGALPWGNTSRDGTVKPPACWQPTGNDAVERFGGTAMSTPITDISEDCLYLNVWRPKYIRGPKTIMVWIHGGGFWTGSAVLDADEGSELAAREDVILVTVAYRLGPLGFSYIRNRMNANQGLFDQLSAYMWIKTNAANLGGSPGYMTLFGQDAGAAIAGLQLISSFSPNLFTNVIMQSGSPVSPWAVMDEWTAHNRTLTAVESLGCNSSHTADQLNNCVRGLNVEDLSSRLLEMASDKWFDLPLAPVRDGFILKESPIITFKKNKVKLTDVIIGVNKDEGIRRGLTAGFKDTLLIEQPTQLEQRQQFRNVIKTIAGGDEDLKQSLLREYRREFQRTDYVSLTRRLHIVDAAIGDSQYKCPTLEFARDYTRRGGRVYLYSFEENLSSNPYPDWMGVPRGSEVDLVFGGPLKPASNNTVAEKLLTKQVMALWASLAKRGTPSAEGVTWPVFTLENEEYVQINATGGIRPASHLRESACAVWLPEHQQNSAEPAVQPTDHDTKIMLS